MSSGEPVPFHEWKDKQIKKDSLPHLRVYRSREWYWQAYGNYCRKVRNEHKDTVGVGRSAIP